MELEASSLVRAGVEPPTIRLSAVAVGHVTGNSAGTDGCQKHAEGSDWMPTLPSWLPSTVRWHFVLNQRQCWAFVARTNSGDC